jgi:surface carbohydrate biosynthesis protein (TIGR04326 family)
MKLVVLWEFPESNFTLQKGDVLLSFCDPELEIILKNEFSSKYKFHLARDIGLEIKKCTTDLYQSLITKLSIQPIRNGKNLRELLFNDEIQSSEWFFNPMSFRDCEASDLYKNILVINIISHVKKITEIDQVVLFGEPAEISVFFEYNKLGAPNFKLNPKVVIRILFKSIFQNAIVFFTNIYYFILFKFYYKNKKKHFETKKVALSGFYDWSFNLDDNFKIKDDKYFKDLVGNLSKKGINYIYLCWFEPNTIPNSKFKLRDLIKAVGADKNLTLINEELHFFDIFKSYYNSFRIYFKVFKILNNFYRKNDFEINGYNLIPLLSKDLFSSLVSFEVLKYNLIYKAFKKYFDKNKSLKVFLSFLEHYPYTRALCLAANNKLDIISMQHASYSHGKTFYYLDPNHEFVSSEIDGLILPHPNQIIIMGNRNKALFESVGYKSDDVLQYGSLRYKDKSEIINSHTKVINNDSFNILLPLSIKESIHVDLIMAVYTAIKGILNVRVIIRNHPYHNIRDNYWVMTNLNLENFQFSENTLLDDLNNSDLIISSYSTVAEEGLLMGIPVIQWASLDFEGSPLFCDPRVSTVSNVIELRNTIKKIIQNYEQYKPSLTTIDEIYADYFSPSHNSNTLISNYIESKI